MLFRRDRETPVGAATRFWRVGIRRFSKIGDAHGVDNKLVGALTGRFGDVTQAGVDFGRQA